MFKTQASFRHVVIRVIALALGILLVVAALLTVAVAGNFYDQMDLRAYEYIEALKYRTRTEEGGELPGVLTYHAIKTMGESYHHLKIDPFSPLELPQFQGNLSRDSWLWSKRESLYGYDFTINLYRYNNATDNFNLIMTRGNRLAFAYTYNSGWQDRDLSPKGYGWVDLDAIPGAVDIMAEYMSDSITGSLDNTQTLPVIRLEGWFQDSQFHPIKLERAVYIPEDSSQLSPAVLNDLDHSGNLQWQALLSHTNSTVQPTVTIYGWDVVGILGNEPNPFCTNTVSYATQNDDAWDSYVYSGNITLHTPIEQTAPWETVRCYSFLFRTSDFHRCSYYLTLRYNPLQYALLRLIPAYLILTVLTALGVWLILRRFHRNITAPLAQLATAIANNAPLSPSATLDDVKVLEEQYCTMHQTLTDIQAENTRLEAALDNAQDAESRRKELISNLAHELKTPLAVIHSYCEGLQLGIAPEKRDRYIQTLLEETDRMGGMVKQMQDLSHLDTGKVELNTENFSLDSMIRSVAEKFQPMIVEKRLNLYLRAEDIQMNADISRMEQVITNYLSNAVKYTPEGGQILVKAVQKQSGIAFNITNTAAHLSDKALERVYDSFYRVDTARTEKSTGLGLAIVKGIMTLHGYQCYVRNSLLDGAQAIEFGFFPSE
jgi:signal transduction histidine kinase